MDLDVRIKELHAGHSPSFPGALSMPSTVPSSSISNYRFLYAEHKMGGSVPLVQHPIQSVRKGHRAIELKTHSLSPSPARPLVRAAAAAAVMRTPTPLPSLSPGNTSCPGSRLLPCWPWTAQNSTLSCMFWKHTRYFRCSPLFFDLLSLFSVIPLGSCSSSSAAVNDCCCSTPLPPSSAATN